MRATRILVSGVVQGVGYRQWTRRRAIALALAGWVRNLYDGRVEILVEGDVRAVDQLVAECADGPRYADVANVEPADVPATGLTGFAVHPTA